MLHFRYSYPKDSKERFAGLEMLYELVFVTMVLTLKTFYAFNLGLSLFRLAALIRWMHEQDVYQ